MGKGSGLSRGWRGWREVGPHEEGLGHRTEGPGKMSEVSEEGETHAWAAR